MINEAEVVLPYDDDDNDNNNNNNNLPIYGNVSKNKYEETVI
jgi:hypothetical protein